MARIFLNINGNGNAYSIPPAGDPMVDGESFTIYFVPDGGATLDSVRAFDSHDYAVALPPITNNQLTMNFRSGWGNLYVDVYFSGSTPPGPGGFPIWLLFKFRKKRKRYVK